MNYELTKKLRDAGFEYKKIGLNAYPSFDTPTEKVLIPTLSELIEACGDRFKGLFPPTPLTPDCWFAVEKVGQINREGIFTEWSLYGGSIPEEAVANLWLSLQDKK